MKSPCAWYATQAKAAPDLFRVIYDFNRRPQQWVHPAVIDALPHAAVIKGLSTTNRGAAHLSAWLNRELRLDEDEPCWDFEEPRARLALLSAETLHRLARYAGAACCWPGIAATIGRDQCRELKAAVGEDAHIFALRRGRLVVSEADALPRSDSATLASVAMHAGWRMVTTAAYHESPSVQRRLALKLPPDVAQILMSEAPAADDSWQKAWLRVRKITSEVLTGGELSCFS